MSRSIRGLALTRYARLGASSRIRHYDLLPGLAERGFHFDIDHFLDEAAVADFYAGRSRSKADIARAYLRRALLVAAARRYDLIWIEKEVFPWLPWAAEGIAYGISRAATVVDFDDDWPDRYARHSAGPIRRFGAKFERILSTADAVTAANPVLARKLEARGAPSVQVIYNAIDLERYARAGRAAPQRRGPMRVGWIGTPFTAATHLAPVAGTLVNLARDGLVHIVLVGAGDAVPEICGERRVWSEATEADDIATFDVGLMPLGTSDFDAGKSAWKLVQCMAAGRAVVASPVGFSAMLVEDGKTGFLAPDEETLRARLVELAEAPKRVRAMGAAAQAALSPRYGIEATLAATTRAFEYALERARERRGDLR